MYWRRTDLRSLVSCRPLALLACLSAPLNIQCPFTEAAVRNDPGAVLGAGFTVILASIALAIKQTAVTAVTAFPTVTRRRGSDTGTLVDTLTVPAVPAAGTNVKDIIYTASSAGVTLNPFPTCWVVAEGGVGRTSENRPI